MSGRKGFTVRGRSVDGGLTNVYICGSDTSYRVRPSGALERSFTLVATLGSVCGYHVQFELLKIIDIYVSKTPSFRYARAGTP